MEDHEVEGRGTSSQGVQVDMSSRADTNPLRPQSLGFSASELGDSSTTLRRLCLLCEVGVVLWVSSALRLKDEEPDVD